MTEPAHELNIMWALIHNCMYYIQEAIHSGNNPPDGMPGTKSNPRKLPCHEYAFSLEEAITRRATYWTGEPNPTHWLSKYAHILEERLGEQDQLNFQTETHTFHAEAKQYEPGHVLARALTGKDLESQYCPTMAHLAQYLTAITGKKIPEGTIRYWKHEGHITHTSNGYSLAQAYEHATR